MITGRPVVVWVVVAGGLSGVDFISFALVFINNPAAPVKLIKSTRLPGTMINSEQDARRQMLRLVKQGFDLVTNGRQQP